MIFFNITWLQQPNGGDNMKVVVTKGPMFDKVIADAQKYLGQVLIKEMNKKEEKVS